MGDNPTVRLDIDNEPQPDAVLLIEESAGGQARLSEDDYVEGAPEMVIEIAASSAAIDLHGKKRAYRRNGVQEYIVWQVLEQKLSWFSLQGGDYVSLTADADGVVKSRIFPGLWLAESALLTGKMQRVQEVLQDGLNSTDHAAFVQRSERCLSEATWLAPLRVQEWQNNTRATKQQVGIQLRVWLTCLRIVWLNGASSLVDIL